MDPKFFNGPTVPINELLVPLLTGGATESVEYWVRKLDVVVVEDWFGRRALKLEDARRVTQAYHAAKTEHEERWAAYQQWKEDRRAKERAAAQKARADERTRIAAIKDAKRRAIEEQNLRDREEALRAAEEAAGPSFQEWSQNPIVKVLGS